VEEVGSETESIEGEIQVGDAERTAKTTYLIHARLRVRGVEHQ